MPNNEEEKLSDYRIDQLEKQQDKLVTLVQSLVTKVTELSTKMVFGAAVITLIINVGSYFISKQLKGSYSPSEKTRYYNNRVDNSDAVLELKLKLKELQDELNRRK